jgi:hypothetical protein
LYSASVRVIIAETGSVETPIETNNRSWRLFAFRASAPAASGIPPVAITPDKVEKYSGKRRGQGDAPRMLLPPPGERESPSWLPQRISELQRKRGFLMKIVIIRYNERRFIFYPCDERRRPKTGRPRGGLSD